MTPFRTCLVPLAAATALTLAGCHHAPVRVSAPPPPAVSAGPVMVSVPPPTHRSSPAAEAEAISNDIPVMKPVAPPRRTPRHMSTPTVAAAPAPPVNTATVTPPAAAPVNLGQLTAGDDNVAAARENAAQALRTQRERLASLSAGVQSAHPAEVEQARRFLKSGGESFAAADYAATLGLATKTRVLLDDLLK